MRCTLQVNFYMDDLDDEAEEKVESIRKEVHDIVADWSETSKPDVKIWDTSGNNG